MPKGLPAINILNRSRVSTPVLTLLRRYQVPVTQAAELTDDQILYKEREDLEVVKKLREDPNHSIMAAYKFLPKNVEPTHLTGYTLNRPGELALPQLVFRHNKEPKLTTVVHLGKKLAGHPGIAHGGFLCTLLDEALFRAVMNQWPNRGIFTGQLNVKYLKPVFTDQFVLVRSEVERVEGRKGFCKGTVEDIDGNVLTEANGIFIATKEKN
ncbi:Thioesterase/thiol ester dehydrase-isomerase [Basidiobolus meristosporus CBS 931.73]|uniref:Thioesterase/thiol ester dehydrase-isomerase n=1 Tax=Basidiobolus meristosporus CBS 931.73 TaxID=1314790 RepID=A0A1Y1XIJ3_9FUNG|nr:Thioesterase/thiol ester dehydrase-isomerase [Basidiobolus meristosporus CBS 931.73]|eukprot:ORX85575.1 Thioesterase/thiol ester dehydrase-isomerase [Basidiobolus meristosporus CBS 931.73]